MSTIVAAISTADATVLLVVVGARLVVPLFIPRFPLPAILIALVLDAADQSIFQQATDLDLTGYQSYDKALDVYYLAIAYTSVMRNWPSPFMHSIGAFLWYFRLVGVTIFELTEARWVLLVFPNTFEYFFIAIEVVRIRSDPGRLTHRTVVLVAAAIWIFVKLPQEYWIHVAQLDTTDLIKEDLLGVTADTPWGEAFAENRWAYAVMALLAVLVVVGVQELRRRLPPGAWATTFRADTVGRHVGWVPTGPRPAPTPFLGRALAEKVVLVGLASIIFLTVYPESEAVAIEVFAVAALTVAVNAAISAQRERRGEQLRTVAGLFAATLVINLFTLWFFANLLAGDRTVSLRDVSFFAYLIAILVTLYDRARERRARCETAITAEAAADPVR